MVKYLIVIVGLFLVGCDKGEYTYRPINETSSYVMPDSLKDCEVVRIDGEGVPQLYVVRCGLPIPTTTTREKIQQGKTYYEQHVITIDGVKYQKID